MSINYSLQDDDLRSVTTTNTNERVPIEYRNDDEKRTEEETKEANKSTSDDVKITLRGRENEETIEIAISEEMSKQDALEKIKALLVAYEFGKDEFNQIEIPYHPKLVGIINTLKESLPEGTALELLMNGDVSKILGEIDKASLKEALKDFEQADTITFRTDAEKEKYIAAISEFPDIIKNDSKYQVKPNEYFAKFAKPMNNRNKSDEESKKSQGSKKLPNVPKPKQGR
jgi:hypothetical protein